MGVIPFRRTAGFQKRRDVIVPSPNKPVVEKKAKVENTKPVTKKVTKKINKTPVKKTQDKSQKNVIDKLGLDELDLPDIK